MRLVALTESAFAEPGTNLEQLELSSCRRFVGVDDNENRPWRLRREW